MTLKSPRNTQGGVHLNASAARRAQMNSLLRMTPSRQQNTEELNARDVWETLGHTGDSYHNRQYHLAHGDTKTNAMQLIMKHDLVSHNLDQLL